MNVAKYLFYAKKILYFFIKFVIRITLITFREWRYTGKTEGGVI